MRSRKEITSDGSRPEFLILEVLLDIRDLIVARNTTKKRGKPKKKKGGVL